MAHSISPSTFQNGFKQPSSGEPWRNEPDSSDYQEGDYITPPSCELLTSMAHNDLGHNVLRTWPTLYDGTNTAGRELPSWWQPSEDVDVLICGAGPSGLQMGVSLARQGVKFRILDASDGPLIAGRADGVQPRFLEVLNTWGLANEVAEEGPLIERTAIYKDGKKLLFGRSHQSDSRYRGLHVITQGQIERIYIRDLTRHQNLVERSTKIAHFDFEGLPERPVQANIVNSKTGQESRVRAKYLVGCDGASSMIRRGLDIGFQGVSTDIYWGILDCVFESDYPHAWVFGSVVSSKHGGCVIIPRENGYIRLYTQLDTSSTGPIAQSRQASDKSFQESGGRVDSASVTPEEVLEQANRIFAPYKLRFAAPLSWFAVWKISERVADSFSSANQRCHLVGDSAHVHSVMGAFGLNASIMDAGNLAWKLGLCSKGLAKPSALLPTYSSERRLQAVRIIKASGTYLRFVCNSEFPLAMFDDVDQLENGASHNGALAQGKQTSLSNDRKTSEAEKIDYEKADAKSIANGTSHHQVNNALSKSNGQVNGISPKENGLVDGERTSQTEAAESDNTKTSASPPPSLDSASDLEFLGHFFATNGPFLLGVDAPYSKSVLAPNAGDVANKESGDKPVDPFDGVRAPNPRVCFSTSETGYIYDKMRGADTFHVVAFLSNMQGKMRSTSRHLLRYLAHPESFYHTFGGSRRFNIILVVKCLPFELPQIVSGEELNTIHAMCQVVFDDRAPDEDAHTTYGVKQREGAVVIVRPDLWIGTSVKADDASSLITYFDGFLNRAHSTA